jgi:hypothetical protein
MGSTILMVLKLQIEPGSSQKGPTNETQTIMRLQHKIMLPS